MDPNALWAALPGAASPASVTITPPSWVRWAQPVEWVGRAAVVIIPVFCRFRLATVASMLAGEVMLLALAFYYTGWTRYFTGGRTPVLLYEPLFRVLLPLAVRPVVFFLAAALVMGSVPLAAADVVFGTAHLAIAGSSTSASSRGHVRPDARDTAGSPGPAPRSDPA
jgi:hypothetical protein